ncbi:hypothetical protein BDW42DRAFT_74915 [Aspergillus taichungensis]|uniref:Uncharacterized protein n=1 Tax=Aspergillus taichungensis TaxID=482145 RepID=A0A2J5HZ74_9EURO|nr:hypothetical protein BDW42DRAFT_74915 [Aspergillus taichungensis]
MWSQTRRGGANETDQVRRRNDRLGSDPVRSPARRKSRGCQEEVIARCVVFSVVFFYSLRQFRLQPWTRIWPDFCWAVIFRVSYIYDPRFPPDALG